MIVDDSIREARAKAIAKELAELEAELEQAGISGSILTQFFQSSRRMKVAILILLEHLQRDYMDTATCVFAQMLRVKLPETRRAWPLIADIYRERPEGRGFQSTFDTEEYAFGAKDALADALSGTYSNEHFELLSELLLDKANGPSRIILVQCLRRRRKSPDVISLLKKLVKDQDLTIELQAWRPPVE